LLKSHMMPAALYGNRKKEFEISTFSGTIKTKTQIKQPLCCEECEQRFNQGGETHVLDVIAPKNTRGFPLHERMQIAYARDRDPSVSRFYGPDFSLDMDKFAYFAVSVVWRVAASQWLMQDGNLTQEVNLGTFQENMRRYLLGETPLPSDMAVIVIVCSDVESRKRFCHPSGHVEGAASILDFYRGGSFPA
jgi:hypothetical protein